MPEDSGLRSGEPTAAVAPAAQGGEHFQFRLKTIFYVTTAVAVTVALAMHNWLAAVILGMLFASITIPLVFISLSLLVLVSIQALLLLLFRRATERSGNSPEDSFSPEEKIQAEDRDRSEDHDRAEIGGRSEVGERVTREY